MKYGFIKSVDTSDMGCDLVSVSVDFVIKRSVLYEFADCLMPVNVDAEREPIAAILEHSCVEVGE